MDIGKPIKDCSWVGAGRGHAGADVSRVQWPSWLTGPAQSCPVRPPQMFEGNPSLVSWCGLSVLRRYRVTLPPGRHRTPAPTQDPPLLLPVKCGPCEYAPNMWILFVFLVYSRNNINQWPNICGWCWVGGHVTRDGRLAGHVRLCPRLAAACHCFSRWLMIRVYLVSAGTLQTPHPASPLSSYVIILHRNTADYYIQCL